MPPNKRHYKYNAFFGKQQSPSVPICKLAQICHENSAKSRRESCPKTYNIKLYFCEIYTIFYCIYAIEYRRPEINNYSTTPINHLQNKPNKAHRHKQRPARNTHPARIKVTTSRLELKNSQEIDLFCFKIGYFYIYLRQIRQRPNRIQLPKRRDGRAKVIENQRVHKFSKP